MTQQSATTVRSDVVSLLFSVNVKFRTLANLVGGTVQVTSEQVLVPDAMVGLIIGRGGEQNSRLQSESKCKIQMAQVKRKIMKIKFY